MALKVVNLARPFKDVALFRSAGIEFKETNATTTEAVIDALRDADGAMIGIWPLTDRQVLDACPKLKVVSRSGVGVDSIDLEAATELGICACNTPGINTTEVADHAMALLLSITRQIPEQRSAVKAGAWSEDAARIQGPRSKLRRIAGHTVGIAATRTWMRPSASHCRTNRSLGSRSSIPPRGSAQ